MNKKKLFQGLVVGLLANIIGLITAAIVLGKLSGLSDNILTVLESAQSENFLGKLISLGAILNLAAFFIFIKKKQDYRARGVLLITVFVAVFTFVFKLF